MFQVFECVPTSLSYFLTFLSFFSLGLFILVETGVTFIRVIVIRNASFLRHFFSLGCLIVVGTGVIVARVTIRAPLGVRAYP